MDMTGLGRQRIHQLVEQGARRIQPDDQHEQWAADPGFAPAVETLAAKAFTRAVVARRPGAERAVVVCALMGPSELARLVTDTISPDELSAWSESEIGYLNSLVESIAELACDFYAADANARGFATAHGVGELLVRQREDAERLTRIERQLSATDSAPDSAWVSTGGRDAADGIRVVLDPNSAHQPLVRRCHQWVRWALEAHGYPVRGGATPNSGDELTVMVTRASNSDRDALDPDAAVSNGRLLKVAFDDDATMHLDGPVRGASAASARLRQVIDPLVDGRRRLASTLEYDDASELPRLRRLSDQAIRDAAVVGSRSFEEPGATGGLYVHRDLEKLVLEALSSDDLVVVSGDAGAGKTSLLWGLAQQLVAGSDPRDVYFVKAGHLIPSSGDPAVVTGAALVSAVRARALESDSVVLIDTADLLVNDVRAFDALMATVSDVREAGGSVVITSRPAEALTITAGANAPLLLRSFSTEAGTGQESEFARAVRAHAIAYCSVPGDTSALAQQLLRAAVRGTPLGDLARLPLSLRMLFELYAPGTVPEQISATALFDRFWSDRVTDDRRHHHRRPTPRPSQRDLSAACLALAGQMVAAGLPEARTNGPRRLLALPAPSADDIEALCNRGIGATDPNGVFTFFHQAFFEYAAARLIISYPGGLERLLLRTVQRPDDYFISPVAEQAWILAFNRGDRAQEAAAMAKDHLQQSRVDLVRRVLRVLAQAEAPQGIAEHLTTSLSRVHIDLVKEHLRLLPRPQTAWRDRDSALLAGIHSRSDQGSAVRRAITEVLVRLALAHPAAAFAASERILAESSQEIFDSESIDHAGTRALISVFCRTDPGWVMTELDSAFENGSGLSSSSLTRILDALTDAPLDGAAAAVEWADAACDRVAETSSLLTSLKTLHSRALSATPATDPVRRLRTTLGGGKSRRLRRSAEIASAWAQVETIVDVRPHQARRMLDLILAQDDPRFHEHLHHGWLTRPLADSQWFRAEAGNILAAGLPSNRRSPQGPPQRWADTVRRALSRPDASPEVVVDVVTSCVAAVRDQWSVDALWTDDDALLWILLFAANAGEAGAMDVLDRLTCRRLTLDSRRARIAVQQGQHIYEAGPGIDSVVGFLVSQRAWTDLRNLMEHVPGLPIPEPLSSQLIEALIEDGAKPDRRLGAQALEVLIGGVRAGVLARPPWSALEDVRRNAGKRAQAALAQLAVDGITSAEYEAAEVLAQLRKWVEHKDVARETRLQLVRAESAVGDTGRVRATLDRAFSHPVDAGIVVALAGYLNRDRRLGPAIPSEDAVRLLIEVGHRLALPGLSNSTRKDVAGAWREIFGRVLNRASNSQLVEVVAEIPAMSDNYARQLLAGIPARHTPELRNALIGLRDGATTDPAIARIAEQKLKTATAVASNTWEEFDEELHELAEQTA